jgi:hypothetical protein
LNRDIVGAMLTVKESMLTDGTVAELADDDEAEAEVEALDELDELDEDEQPAAIRARAAATATQPSLGKRRNVPSPCVREDRPPLLLLLTRIPHTLSPECIRISRPGHRYSRGVPSEGS